MQLSKSYFKAQAETRKTLGRLEAQLSQCSACYVYGCGNSIFRKKNIKVKEILKQKAIAEAPVAFET